VDAVFETLRQDSQFLALTSGADGKLMMPMPMKDTRSMQNQQR